MDTFGIHYIIQGMLMRQLSSLRNRLRDDMYIFRNNPDFNKMKEMLEIVEAEIDERKADIE